MNTPWDMARFEVTCHKFANLDEYGYGVAILNDCKYGFAVHGNVMRLSLIRASKAPDGNADIGRHFFRYGILPHRESLHQSNVVKAGFNFNSPLRVVKGSLKLPEFRVKDAPSVILETIKKAEDDDSVVLRTYETYGGSVQAKIQTSLKVSKCVKVNVLEDEMGIVEILPEKEGTSLQVNYKPFEIVTLKLLL